jgi:transposase
MLHAGLDLSRKKLDVWLLSDQGEHLDQLAVPPDVDSLKTLARRISEVHREPVRAVVESMTGARLVHDTLEREGWDVEIADAQKAKGLSPLACKTDKIDSLVLAVLSHKRVHSTLINFGRPCPVTDLFGAEGRRLLARLEVPALKHPVYSARYQRNKKRLGKQRGAKVAQVEIARRLAHAIWHMLSRGEELAPRGATARLAPDRPLEMRPRAKHPISPDPPDEEAIET